MPERNYRLVYSAVNTNIEHDWRYYPWSRFNNSEYVNNVSDLGWKEKMCDRRDIILYIHQFRIRYPNRGFDCLVKNKKEIERYRECGQKEYSYLDDKDKLIKFKKDGYYIPNHDYFIITKVSKDGSEKEVNYDALKKEIEYREDMDKLPRWRHDSLQKHYGIYCNWKKQNKRCRHQWQIHLNKHTDTIVYDKRNYDSI